MASSIKTYAWSLHGLAGGGEAARRMEVSGGAQRRSPVGVFGNESDTITLFRRQPLGSESEWGRRVVVAGGRRR
jgi:hypothetical protein